MSPAVVHSSWSLLARIAEPAARSLVLGCFAALAIAVLRVKSVRLKLAVWRGVLVAALMMPLAMIVVPPIRVFVPVPSLGAAAPAPAAHENQSERAPLLLAPEVATPQYAAPSIQPGTKAVNSDAHTQSQRPVGNPRQYSWPLLLLATYLGAAVLLLVRFFVGLRLGCRLESSSQRIEESIACRALCACAHRAGCAAQPRLAESTAIAVPLTLGIRKPVIFLPVAWREWQPDELEAVLAHEVSHVVRQDALFQRLALLHRALFWFNPLAWWLERHLAELAEQASDEAALASGADRRRYAETLLGFFAALETSPARVWWQGLSMAQAGRAEKRVDRILAWRGAMPNKLKKSLVVGFAAVALPVVALTATLHTEMYAEYNDQEPARPQAPPAPAMPAPSANPVVAPGPAPQAPNATPAPAIAPNGPDVGPVPPGASQAAPVPEPPQDLDPGTVRQAKETLRRAQAALTKADQALSVAKSQLSTTASETQLQAFNAAQAAYATALSKYEADLQYLEEVAQEQQARESAPDYRFYHDYEQRFVIITKNSDSVTMSGSQEDVEHARALRSKIPGDFIWFERDEKSYIIRDQATVDRAKALWKPQEELGRKQEELGKQQEALGKQQEALGEKMEQVRVKIPDLTAQMQKLEAEMKQLSANGGTVEQIGDLQSEIGDLQSRIGKIQADAGQQQGEIGRQQGELGRKQGELGRQQGELGRQQGELARQANRQMKELLHDAVAKGIAQPEETAH